jgi:hypothetical protein
MKIRCANKLKSAMTLVDVVMAVAVLGVMASGIFGSFRYGFFTLQLVRENQRATQIILEKVETIRLYSWDQIQPTNNFIPATFTDVYDPQAAANAQGTIYNGTVAVANCPLSSSYSACLRQLTVTLSWTTRDIPHTRSLTTYIARDGIQNYVY